MTPYLDLLRHVLEHGTRREDRTGTGTLSVFGHQMRFDLQRGFPLVTTKKVFFKGLAVELLWFLRGETNVGFLQERGVHIWDPWADAAGDLGPVYGKQWVRWETADGRVVNQVARLVEGLRTKPHSRRHLVSAWNVGELEAMALPPCHLLFQFYVAPPPEGALGNGAARDRLSCQLYIRSNDLFLGAPFNIAEYALLVHLVAQQTDLDVGELVYTIGDAHVYLNHLDAVREQLTRTPYPLPRLRLRRRPPSIFDYRYEDFELVDYRYHPAIKAPVAV